MAQTFTLEEAAQRLALSIEEFKRRHKEEWKHIRSFRDGATLRFRASDIDELARMMGERSDPGLQLPDPDITNAPTEVDGSDEFLLPPETPADSSPGISLGGQDHPLLLQSNDSEFVLPKEPAASKRIPKPSQVPDKPSDSDVCIDAMPAGYSENNPDFSMPTEDITLDISGPGSAVIKPSASSTKLGPRSSHKLTGPPSATRLGNSPPSKISGPPSGKIPSPAAGRSSAADDSSEFDLNLDMDGDSFELNLANDSSDEVDLGGLDLGPPAPSAHGMRSGINLGKPADSGLALDSDIAGPKSGMMPKSGAKSGAKGTAPADSSDIDFELSMDPSPSRTGPRSQRMAMDSDSEFELSLDEELNAGDSDLDAPPKTGILDASEGKDDIFETDFELPAIGEDESGSEVVAVDDLSEEPNSDFDLAISEDDAITDEESASQVVLVDDEEAPILAEDEEPDLGDALAGVETDDSPSASAAMRGVRRGDDDDEEEEYTGRPVPMAPARWGALPAVVLLPTLLLTFVGGLMSFEMLRGMWGYHQPTPPQNLIVKGLAGALDMKVND